jgi:hypothetical protein
VEVKVEEKLGRKVINLIVENQQWAMKEMML